MATRPVTPAVTDWQDVNDWQDTPSKPQLQPVPPTKQEQALANAPGFLGTFGSLLWNAIKASPSMMASFGSPATPQEMAHYVTGGTPVGEKANSLVQNDVARRQDNRAPAYRAVAALGEGVTPLDVRGMEEQAKIGNTRGVLAHAAAATTMAVAPSVVSRVAPKIAPKLTNQPLSAPEAANQAATAISKALKRPDLPEFRSVATEKIGEINGYARQSGTQVKTLQDAANVARQAAEADPYRQTYIEPYKDAPTGVIGTVGGKGQELTVGQASARLSQINGELYGGYSKGGANSPASQAALSSERAAQLNAEASSLREGIAQGVSRASGIDAETVRSARSGYDKKDLLRFHIENAASEQFLDQAARKTTPVTLGDFNPLYPTKTSVGKRVPLNPRNWGSTTPADRMIADVFKRGPATPVLIPEANPTAAIPRSPLSATPTTEPVYDPFKPIAMSDISGEQLLRQAARMADQRVPKPTPRPRVAGWQDPSRQSELMSILSRVLENNRTR